MTDQEQLDTECSIHAMLCGRLAEAEQVSLLKRLARDDQLRDLLAEIIQTQELARAAYGYPIGDPSVPVDLTRAIAASAAGAEHPSTSKPEHRRLLAFRPWRRALWRVAAIVVIAASVFVAVDVHRSNVLLRDKLATAGIGEPIQASQLQPSEIQRLRGVWNQIADRRETSRPWILLSNGSGEFGYVGGVYKSGERQPIVLRLTLVSAEGKVVETSNLLLPEQAIGKLSLADIGRLWGLPLGLVVDSSNSRTRVALTVSRGGDDGAGISGRVQVGNVAEEIGWLRVAGKDVKVIVQAFPLRPNVS